MAISGVGATPQPESRDYSPNKRREERFVKLIFDGLNKDGNEVIDEKDGLEKTLLDKLKETVGNTLNFENFKNKFVQINEVLTNYRYTKDGVFNGKKAKISYDWTGKLRSVNTGAQNVTEARRHMGLDKKHVVGCNTGDITTYGREYKKNNGTQKEYFVWNPQTKSMDFEWGCWSAD